MEREVTKSGDDDAHRGRVCIHRLVEFFSIQASGEGKVWRIWGRELDTPISLSFFGGIVCI